jgi:hypothetical protein
MGATALAMMGMPIHDWPEQERPREKLIARGPATLSDAELLALFLGSGFGGRDAVQTARDLLQAHGPLRVLLDRPPPSWPACRGWARRAVARWPPGWNWPIATWRPNWSTARRSATTRRRSAATCSTACAARPARSSWRCSWTTATA